MNIPRIKWKLLLLVALLLVGSSLPSRPQAAQAQSTIVLTLSVPTFIKEFMDDTIIERFEADHPGVEVVVVGVDIFSAGDPASDIDSHLESVQKAVTSGDVAIIDESFLSPEAIRAGFYLDLTPLTSVDPSFNANDYIAAALQSFQWNNGLWGIPQSVNPITISYDIASFDSAGVPYPNANWTFDDYEAAIRQLARINANGEVELAGFTLNSTDVPIFLRALLGHSLVDSNDSNASPNFDDADLQALLERWQALVDEGLIATSGTFTSGESPALWLGNGVGTIAVSFSTDGSGNFETPATGRALLPGSKGGLSVDGLVVSSGTQQPQLAYQLAAYLANDPQASSLFLGGYAQANQTLNTPDNQAPDGNGSVRIGGRGTFGMSEAEMLVLDEAINNALPITETYYFNYLNTALSKVSDEGLDIHTALQETESEILANFQTASDYTLNNPIFVNTPAPTRPLNPGEIALNFAYISNIRPLPNQSAWDQFLTEFTDTDPDVGRVDMEVEMGFGADVINELAEQYECFVLNYNAVQSANLDSLLSLDPFLLDDSTFNTNNLVNGALEQVQRDNRTWGYPIEISPQVLWYNLDLFNQYGLYLPDAGWTPEAFADALRQIQSFLADGEYAFSAQGIGSNYMLMLIAAFGGLPIDYSTTTPTINFTDPNTVEAIRQVLDLAKNGYMEYQSLDVFGGGNVIRVMGAGENTPIYSGSLNPNVFGGGGFAVAVFSGGSEDDGNNANVPNPYKPAPYPQGSLYTPISYQMTTGYISANAQNPAACYRLLKAIAQESSLNSGMPVDRNLINSPEVLATQGQEVVNFYNQYDNMLQSPSVVQFNEQLGVGQNAGNMFYTYWLNRALDRYVLENADLDTELADAQQLTQAYLECTASIPSFDAAAYNDPFEYNERFTECATRVDPDLSSLFSR